jgi:PKD repeat protein
MSTTCLFPALGNHEGHAPLYYSLFSTPAGGGTGGEQWYSFDYGNAHFIALDTDYDYSLGSAQYNWLVRDLQATQADWSFVFTHYSPFSSGPHGGSANEQQLLVPLFEQYEVDMVFAGHDHLYERSFRNGVYYIVTGGGGAPLYSCGTTSNPLSQFCRPVHHYCTVDINGGTATFTARDSTGAAFDTLTISQAGNPTADFTANPPSGLPPLDVYFTDQSGQWPTSWSWNFGDGETSTQQNPSHQYTTSGSYTVSLTASGPDGSDTETKPSYISVGQSCHVGEITLSVMRPPTYRVRAIVMVHDQDCKPLAGANVTVTWSGLVSASSTRTSGSDGQAVFILARSRRGSALSCCVTKLTKAQYLYDSSKNHTSCSSVSQPSRQSTR